MQVIEHESLILKDLLSSDFFNENLLSATKALADGPLAELADDIDRKGFYPKSVLMKLGEIGALSAHMAPSSDCGRSADYGLAIQAMTEVGRVCGSTAFMMWCHLVCGVYMEPSDNPSELLGCQIP